MRHGGAWTSLILSSKRGITNFGDELSPILMREFTGQRVVWSPLAKADVVSVGSVLNTYTDVQSRARIIGSGVRQPTEQTRRYVSEAPISSVRGKLTRDHLGLAPETALGDPGIAIGQLISAGSRRGTKSLIVPHFGVFNTSAGRSTVRHARANGYEIALPNASPLRMAEAISNVQYVVTSSLHAFVFAHAMGTPATLVSFGDRVHQEPAFKYRDYMSVFDREPQICSFSELASSPSALSMARRYADEEVHDISVRIPSLVEGIRKAYTTL